MKPATWALARGESQPLYRYIVARELRATLPLIRKLSVWAPMVAIGLVAFLINAFQNTDFSVDGIGLSVLIARIADLRRRSLAAPTPEDFTLRQEIPNGWLVDLLILDGAAPTGVDRGMLWVEEGRLLFVGRRTSFGLTPLQASGRCQWVSSIPGLRHGLILPLPGFRSLSLAPVVDPHEKAEIAAMIDDWVATGTDTEGQGPPRSVGPGVLPLTGLFAHAVATSVAWLTITLAFLVCFGDLESMVVLAFAAYAAWELGLRHPFLSLRAWQNRLAHELPLARTGSER